MRRGGRLRGQTIHVPRGALHTSANVGPARGRRIVLFSPAGMEGFFLEAGVAGPDMEIDLPAVLQSALRHGWQFDGGL